MADEVKMMPVFAIILAGVPMPIEFASDVDLCEQWRKLVNERRGWKPEDPDWRLPIEFRDEEGNVIFSCAWNALVAIVRGASAPQPGRRKP